VARDAVVFFLVYFGPNLAAPLQFVGTETRKKTDPMTTLFPALAGRLGFLEGTEFILFESTSWATKRIPEGSTCFNSYSAALLLFQVKPGTPIPESSYPWVLTPQPVEAPAEPAKTTTKATKKRKKEEEVIDPRIDELPRTLYQAGKVGTAEQFLRKTADAVVYMYTDQTVPVHRISFTPEMSLDEFKRFLATILGLDYDPGRSAMLVYKKDHFDMKPLTSEIKDWKEYGLTYEFSGNTGSYFHIWVRFIPGMPESEAGQMQEMVVDRGEINKLQPKRTLLFVPKDSPLREIRTKLIETQFIREDEDLRFYKVYLSRIEKQLDDNETLAHCETGLFIAPAPPVLEPDQYFLKGVHVSNESTYLRGILSPFLLIIAANETVPQITERVKAELALPDPELKKIKFMVGGRYASMAFESKLLKGDKTFAEFIEGAVFKHDVYLYVVHPSNTKAEHAQRAVKIYN
jgi:hypothetical protein